MKSIRVRNKKIVVADIPEPQIISPTQVKIKIAYASICGYEAMMYKTAFNGVSDDNLGHEASGIVVETGKAVSSIYKDDAVTLNPYRFCGYCENCQKGLVSYCSNISLSAISYMSEYVVLDQEQVFRLPDKLSLLEGCLIEPLSVCIRAIEKARLTYNRNLLIVGSGAMGLLTLQASLTQPIESVVVLDPNPNKREIASRLGAALSLDPHSENLYFHLMDCTKGLGFDAIIEASGDSQCVTMSFNVLARGGSLILLSMYEKDFSFQLRPLSIYWKDATIQAVYPAYDYFPRAISLAKRLRLCEVVTGVYPYTQAAKAFAEKCSSHTHAKVVIDFYSPFGQPLQS